VDISDRARGEFLQAAEASGARARKVTLVFSLGFGFFAIAFTFLIR